MEINKIKVKDVEYDIKDEVARGLIVGLASEQYVDDAIAIALDGLINGDEEEY